MDEKKAMELINEWLRLAKKVGEMNLQKIEYDEAYHDTAVERMEVIRSSLEEYHDNLKSWDVEKG